MITFVDQKEDCATIEISGKVLKITNLRKVFWPDEGYTKGDLVDYYSKISSYILPYLMKRPESLRRYPNGIRGKSFFQKDIVGLAPDWADTINVFSKSKDARTKYLICNDLAALIFVVNLGCIDINPWNSSLPRLENPDYLVLDLDPIDIHFDYVLKTALAIKDTCDDLQIPSFPKTSGARGLHVYIPLGADYSYRQCRDFAKLLAEIVHEKTKDFTSLERTPRNRQNRVYIDYLQNAKGQTLAAPYSVRPRGGAPVSTPLSWQEVESGIKPGDFTIRSIFERLEKFGDLFRPVIGSGINMEKALDLVSKL